jgi:hypothetical protein
VDGCAVADEHHVMGLVAVASSKRGIAKAESPRTTTAALGQRCLMARMIHVSIVVAPFTACRRFPLTRAGDPKQPGTGTGARLAGHFETFGFEVPC